jgi:hypothetical protein
VAVLSQRRRYLFSIKPSISSTSSSFLQKISDLFKTKPKKSHSNTMTQPQSQSQNMHNSAVNDTYLTLIHKMKRDRRSAGTKTKTSDATKSTGSKAPVEEQWKDACARKGFSPRNIFH